MSVFSLFKREPSGVVARERLQVLLAHERTAMGRADLLDTLRDEIIAVIARHITVDDDKVHVEMERGDLVSTLRVDIEVNVQQTLQATGT